MNAVVAALFAAAVIATSALGYASLSHQETVACHQRNQGRVTVRHIIHRQEISFDEIKDLKDENALRKEIQADYARVQPIDC